jgi:hypothetical protein
MSIETLEHGWVSEHEARAPQTSERKTRHG